jgi:WD40 repeat protein
MTLTEHTDGVAYIDWSPDDTRLVSCSQDKTAKLWDTQVCE